eukprot:COSAG02_NODE_1060_length_14866_cov_3.131916_4_plen_226_part_00
MHLYQSQHRSAQYTIVVALHILLSCAKAINTSVALGTVGQTRLDPEIAKTLDLLWLAFAVFAPFVYPAPRLPLSMKMDDQIAKRQAASRMRCTLPRVFPNLPATAPAIAVLYNVVSDMVSVARFHLRRGNWLDPTLNPRNSDADLGAFWSLCVFVPPSRRVLQASDWMQLHAEERKERPNQDQAVVCSIRRAAATPGWVVGRRYSRILFLSERMDEVPAQELRAV